MSAAGADSSDDEEFPLSTDAVRHETQIDDIDGDLKMKSADADSSDDVFPLSTDALRHETQIDAIDGDLKMKTADADSSDDEFPLSTDALRHETQIDDIDGDLKMRAADADSSVDEEFPLSTDSLRHEAQIDDIDGDQNSQATQWQVARYDVIRKNKTIYEGDMENGRKNGIGTLYDESRKQYVRGLFKDDILVELHFAQFQQNNSQDDVLRFYGLDNLVTSNKHHYVARFNSTSFNVHCEYFPTILDAIHKTIVISKILDDDLKNDLERIRETFSKTLNYKKDTIASLFTSQRDMFQLYLIMKEMPILPPAPYYDYYDQNQIVLSKIYKNKLISNEVRNQAKEVCMAEKSVSMRNKRLPVLKLGKVDFSWKNFLTELNDSDIRRFKSILAKCLPLIPSAFEQIDNLDDQKVFTVRISDIQLFKDLETTSKQHSRTELGHINFHDFTRKYMSGLWNLMIAKIEKSHEKDIPKKSEYTNGCFLQVFKTFLELLDTVCKEKNVQIANMIQIKENFDLSVEIEDDIGSYERRIKFLVDLLNHFKPGDMKKFRYDFDFFKEKESLGTWLKNIKKYVTNYLENLSNIDEQHVIWLFYIHDTYLYLLTTLSIKGDEQKNDITIFLNSLMSLFKTVIQNNDLSPEKVRILANGLIKFAITISPNFELNLKDADKSLAWKQADYLKDYVTKNEQSLDDITNIVDIYQVFWEERQRLFKYNDVYHKLDTWVKFVQEINWFVEYIYDLKIYNNQFLIFLRSVNEFIRLFSGTDFPWYINKSFYESINCKHLIEVKNETYLVKNPKEFFVEISGYPNHYLIQVGLEFLSCTKLFLQNCEWSEKIEASSNLLLLMGTSLINFKKLPSAVDFDKFFTEFTQPFDLVTRNSTDIADFKRRLASLDNYYKYTLELNVMGVEKALNLFSKNEISSLDYSFHSDILKDCYEVYIEKFNKYVEKYILQNNVKELISYVKSKAKRDIKDIDKWNSYYKKVKLPKILAGLSAVWSALESADIINKSEGIKPHVIQILCILRLLGADQSQDGFPSHLAQVLTGQGKSIVLGLLSATLAITGNRVRIICYNKYLVNRDAQQFKIFYSTLNVSNLINYGTFEDMANEIIAPNLKEKNYTLREFVDLLIKNELPIMKIQEEKVSSKTVLLIDEVDVFFTPKFYGNTYNPCAIYSSEDLAKLQLEIWNKISSVNYEDGVEVKEQEINEKIQTYINDLLIETHDEVFKYIVRNTRTFFNRHVEKMIQNAINVRKAKPGDWYYKTLKLLPTGKIVPLDYYGKHDTNSYYDYNNTFMYFKLKKTDFDHQSFDNFGYLIIDCGNISYAMLPNNYCAILGVTGTLQQLFPFEMRAVKSYGISSASDMPTFFGSRKLRETNFSIVEKEDAWITAILDSVWQVVNEGRAVIVFFVDESMIERYRGKFESNLSRYVVLTGNEEVDEVARMIEEAGVAKRITIAIRGMGRGVDFQSNDSSVEAKGGIHVIQTFFSNDVKEETQIKGRTARKDNRGSYESILCREHLSAEAYSTSADTYKKLNEERDKKARRTGEELEKDIKQSEKKHKDTMEFMKMFYTYNPENRDAFFQRYPLLELDE